MTHAPPGTAVYHEINQGWTPETHLTAFQLDALHDLMWAKTVDGVEGRNRPGRTPRPGVEEVVEEAERDSMVMTVGEYMERLNGEGKSDA